MLYAIITAAAFVVTAVLGGLRAAIAGSVAAPPPPVAPSLIRGAVIVLLVGATVVLRVLRASFPAPGHDTDGWWAAQLGRAVALWALVDGAAVVGAVGFVLTGDLLVLTLAAGWAVAMFVRHTPGRLTDG